MLRIVFLFSLIFPLAALAQTDQRVIRVSATGTAQAVPDMATIRLGVFREARTAAGAMQAAAVAADEVLNEVAREGIPPEDVQTSSLSLNPVWDQQGARPREVRGYQASAIFTIHVRDLELVGVFLDRLIGSGANQLNSLTLGISDVRELEDAARVDAVRRARAKAETLAMAAGVSLGEVMSISEGGGIVHTDGPMLRGAMMEAAAMPVAAGSLDVRVNVSILYAISP